MNTITLYHFRIFKNKKIENNKEFISIDASNIQEATVDIEILPPALTPPAFKTNNVNLLHNKDSIDNNIIVVSDNYGIINGFRNGFIEAIAYILCKGVYAPNAMQPEIDQLNKLIENEK